MHIVKTKFLIPALRREAESANSEVRIYGATVSVN